MNGCLDCANFAGGYCNKHQPGLSSHQPGLSFGTNQPLLLPPQHGWICLRCGQSNAPWIPNCNCAEVKTDHD